MKRTLPTGDRDKGAATPPKQCATLSQVHSISGRSPMAPSAPMQGRLFACGARIGFALLVFAVLATAILLRPAEMAERLRPGLLSHHRLRSRPPRRLQQRRVRRGQQHGGGAAAGAVFRAGLSLAGRGCDEDRPPLRQGGRLQRRGHSQGARWRGMRSLCAAHASLSCRTARPRRARHRACRRDDLRERHGVLARRRSCDRSRFFPTPICSHS